MSAAPMRLTNLLDGIAVSTACGDTVVNGLALDSRQIKRGDAFIALKGGTTHGITFAPAALAQGASVVLAEGPAPVVFPEPGFGVEPGIGNRQSGIARAEPAGLDVGAETETLRTAQMASTSLSPLAREGARRAQEGSAAAAGAIDRTASTQPIIWIDGLREQVGVIAARFFGRPSAALQMIGVTGTNGKTSTVQLLASALHMLGARAATIGTLGAGLVGEIVAAQRTTPDAISVHALLAQFRDAGASHVAMEVSSHALDQGRVNAVDFDVAVFTNLSRDHLDYHGNMAAYAATKAKLFAWPGLRCAVIDSDDAFGRELVGTLPASVRRLRFAIDDSRAEVRAQNIRSEGNGLTFELRTPWGEGVVHSPLLGRFNIHNLLGVAGCLGALGYEFAQFAPVLSRLQPVPGRMSRLGGDAANPLIVIDYAHTPDALEQALGNLRKHCAGQLICVFGCGGERDQGKRPLMGAIAERLADSIIVTDDNPRGEDGDAIVKQIVAGMARPQQASIERDRAAAIFHAISSARPGDVVLIAGKGHEPYQEIAGIKHVFDDADVARQALEGRPC
ncbi:MAG TPA: UDP-N-acetylmuramoyl-L-alanyl-D-glutamate--2,6-diaminopimelate ligase [Rudaea sp.]|nr:UDP-N-acetylmuramoyl-L-alanyl-D-glutamate--2,6-diaminopimelate ligase [Rudaea sp.]